MKNSLFLYLLAWPLLVCAQDKKDDSFAIKFGGFIKNDFFYDTRQVVAAREGHFLLWPASPSYDNEGQDINDTPSFNFLSVQTRLNTTITAPEVYGIKTTGHVEGAFFGHSNPDVNGFRLRHAFVRFQRNDSELLFGQYWHPMFFTASFPDVVSFNTGSPFQPFSRNPQIRFTHKLGSVNILAAALSQRDFATVGPNGANPVYLRNAALPDMHLQLHYNLSGAEAQPLLQTGAGIGYKKVVPQLVSQQGYKTNAGVTGVSYTAFARLNLPSITFKAQYFLGENVSDMLMIGGYGISRILNPEKGLVEYAPLRTQSFWVDMHTNGKVVQTGVFVGMTNNSGASVDLATDTHVTGFGTNIKSLFRVSPRLIYNLGKARFALEGEYTNAAFGSVDIAQNKQGVPVNTTDVSNLRLLLAVYLFF